METHQNMIFLTSGHMHLYLVDFSAIYNAYCDGEIIIWLESRNTIFSYDLYKNTSRKTYEKLSGVYLGHIQIYPI